MSDELTEDQKLILAIMMDKNKKWISEKEIIDEFIRRKLIQKEMSDMK